ncbi:hypothetical protein IDJ77_02310 [Mucilaginibacter sp. ZT4R22]|uniref:Outer membrane protein with beta-barrel domain n=1 Tax=Mucilaginibacter pankratovii TaxID=2772110 RepID=A0ABR7WKD9_9SPHI|nr:outer membrane beta-barrel protein [Mucilaginibacter pankratovii]MBD1362631.1 hypothetical protein [Mucilaginibacter pankratovii]
MKRIILICLASVIFIFHAKAQKGNNQLQLGVQLAQPTGELSDIAKLGFGASAKALFGFSSRPQQVTFEVGYNRFGIKDKFLPSGVEAEYRSIPIYTGYRYSFGSIYLEPQAGVAFNTVYASNFFNLKGETKTYFAWATAVGYSYKNADIALRYQSSDVKDESSDINFLSLRVAYRFNFNKNKAQY